MKFLKSHFWYNKHQRNGIFFLIFLVLGIQAVIFFVDFSSDEIIDENQLEISVFQKQYDSLKTIEIERRKPKIYPFNPNYITDYKGSRLGMSLEEIDRLLAFRKTNKFVNSKEEFQKVTKISDALLTKISPFFKFPDWVVKRNQAQNNQKNKQGDFSTKNALRTKISSKDINKITAQDLQLIGIDGELSERIIQYRTKINGFWFDNQLDEVWGLEAATAKKIRFSFKIIGKSNIKKENINTISLKKLLKNPYIDYDLCINILNYRDEVAALQDISELKNIDGFPIEKYDRIVLCLEAK